MNFKKNYALLMVSVVLLSLVSCGSLFKSFSQLSVGERFGDGKYGYLVKVNSHFFISVDFEDTDVNMYLYRLADVDNCDYFGDAKLYYKGLFDKCYSSEENIILKFQQKESFVLINCSGSVNEKISSDIKEFGVDLTMYTEFDL